jgi:hypothetical protein
MQGAVDVWLDGLIVVRPDKQIAIIHERWRSPHPALRVTFSPEGEGMALAAASASLTTGWR